MRTKRWPFVVIEGTDGAGKTTMRQSLVSVLIASGVQPLSLGGFSWLVPEATRVITNVRYRGRRYASSRLAEAFAQDRAASSEQLIRPVQYFRPVCSDRWMVSDAAYGKVLHGIDPAHYRVLAARYEVAKPDLTVLLDVPVEVTAARLADRPKTRRHYWDAIDIQQRLRAELHSSFRHAEGEKVVVNANRPFSEVQADVVTMVGDALKPFAELGRST